MKFFGIIVIFSFLATVFGLGTKKTVAILGASGYTGAELIRLLANHNEVSISVMTADRSAGLDIKAIYPQLSTKKMKDLPKLSKWEDTQKQIGECDVAFCCLPHGTVRYFLMSIS